MIMSDQVTSKANNKQNKLKTAELDRRSTIEEHTQTQVCLLLVVRLVARAEHTARTVDVGHKAGHGEIGLRDHCAYTQSSRHTQAHIHVHPHRHRHAERRHGYGLAAERDTAKEQRGKKSVGRLTVHGVEIVDAGACKPVGSDQKPNENNHALAHRQTRETEKKHTERKRD